MAQFLIKRRQHFAELEQPPSWSTLKWNGRPMRGDIVEVRPNGYWRIYARPDLGGDHGWHLEAFALIQVTGMSYATAKQYQGRYVDNEEHPTVQHKHRYGFSSWLLIPWVKTPVVLDGQTYEEWSYVRANVGGAVQPIDKSV